MTYFTFHAILVFILSKLSRATRFLRAIPIMHHGPMHGIYQTYASTESNKKIMKIMFKTIISTSTSYSQNSYLVL